MTDLKTRVTDLTGLSYTADALHKGLVADGDALQEAIREGDHVRAAYLSSGLDKSRGRHDVLRQVEQELLDAEHYAQENGYDKAQKALVLHRVLLDISLQRVTDASEDYLEGRREQLRDIYRATYRTYRDGLNA